MKKILFFLPLTLFFIMSTNVFAQNPFITDNFTADPTARVFNGRLYVYPSGDAKCPEGSMEKSNKGFCMPGYNVYSTDDLTTWVDHGKIITHNNVPWVKPNSYGMWAPDCVEKNGKYYFYFPATPLDKSSFRRIGVAIADKPEGPFIPQDKYISNIKGIDPNVFIDDDGKAYLYFGGGEQLYWVELNDDMVSIKGNPQVIQGLPEKYKEGPFMFKRDKKYYFTFPHAPEGSEEIAYAIGKSPKGPFKYKGKVMDRWTNGLWTNHHSFVEFKNQWYIFYHSQEIENDQHLRSICIEKFDFLKNGKIPQIEKTKRGVGKIFAKDKIQIDRYSSITNGRTSRVKNTEVVNWAINGLSAGSEFTYNDVIFSKKFSKIKLLVRSDAKNGKLKIYHNTNRLISIVDLPKTTDDKWVEVSANVVESPSGNADLRFVVAGTDIDLAVDWIQFE